MEKSILYLLITFLLNCHFVNAQDTLQIESQLSLNIKGQHNIAAFVNDNSCLNCFFGEILDNPIHHFAIYSGLIHDLKINNKYSIQTGIFAEERSHSGGNNTLSNLVFFPKIKIEALDTLQINQTKICSKIMGGDFWDEDLDDILRLYNIDYQALLASFTVNKWTLSFFTIGDLSKNIGLDLHQLWRTSVSYQESNFKNVLHFSYNELSTGRFKYHLVESDFNLSNYTNYEVNEKLEIQTQISLRLNPELSNAVALVLKGVYEDTNLSLTGSIKFFQANFNQGYYGRQPSFTNGREYIGEQLYPLKNFYRPYSQWAVYTHYSNKDLLAFEFTMDWRKKLSTKFYYFNDLDINVISDLGNNETQIFPFYNIGLECEFTKPLIGRISMTNKHMYLRDSYQTFTVSRKPYLSFGVQLDLNNLRLFKGDLFV